MAERFRVKKDNKPPAFQFYVKDWLSSKSVLAMTPAQCGYYINLLVNAWDNDPPGTLPNEPAMLWKLARAESREIFEVENGPVMKHFLPTRNGKIIYNLKLVAQFRHLKTHKRQRSDAAKSRWLKEKDTAASNLASSSQCSASASTSASASKNVLSLKEKEPKRVFTPPTLEEVSAYMLELGMANQNGIAQHFIDYYEVRGWIPGNSKVKMKSWKAAVRTWKGTQRNTMQDLSHLE